MASSERSPLPHTVGSRNAAQFFSNASNTQITNSTIMNVNGNAYFNPSERHELDLLRSKVSVAALHNSGERYDAPRCHPGTRVGIQADIMKWFDNVDDPQLVLWMYGSAGVGKTAIAQAIATLCYDSKPRRLAGAFFLSRSAPVESKRGDAKHLVATLAYQMANNIPYLGLHIATAIARNRLIFDLDLETQIKELILGPLSALSDETLNKIPQMIFIIDALDECLATSNQAQIVKAFVTAMGQMQHKIPHKLLIASRPESHIKSIFSADENLPIIRSMSLDDEYRAHKDIWRFFMDSFRRFKNTHPSPAIFPPIWPERHDIERLVQRSSGQFIYASTVKKYIQEDGANPVLRLQTILDLTDEPFGELDALYSYVFGQVKNLETALCIMHVVMIPWLPNSGFTRAFCENFLGLPKGGMRLALQGLSSILYFDDNGVPTYHASFYDFLQDEYRSGDFFIFGDTILMRIWPMALKFIPQLLRHDDISSTKLRLEVCFQIIKNCADYSYGPRFEIHKILSAFDMDLIFQFFKKMKHHRLGPNTFALRILSSAFFDWLCWEHQSLVQFNGIVLLFSPFTQLQNWTLKQLKRLQSDEPISRQPLRYLDGFKFICGDVEMCLLQKEMTEGENSWVARCVHHALGEDQISQLMSQYCCYIRDISWLFRNGRLNINAQNWLPTTRRCKRKWHDLVHLSDWMIIFNDRAPPQIDRYLDIQHFLCLNSAIRTAASWTNSRIPESNKHNLCSVIEGMYKYLEKVEKEFSCLLSPLNELDGNTVTEEQVLDRQWSHPYLPHPSDSASFALALTFQTTHQIEYQNIELILPGDL